MAAFLYPGSRGSETAFGVGLRIIWALVIESQGNNPNPIDRCERCCLSLRIALESVANALRSETNCLHGRGVGAQFMLAGSGANLRPTKIVC